MKPFFKEGFQNSNNWIISAKEKKKKMEKGIHIYWELITTQATIILSFNHQNQPVREMLCFFVYFVDKQTKASKSQVSCLKTHSKWETVRHKDWCSETKSQYNFPYCQFNSRVNSVWNNCPISLATKQYQRYNLNMEGQFSQSLYTLVPKLYNWGISHLGLFSLMLNLTGPL